MIYKSVDVANTVADNRIVTGFVSVFGNIDDGRDMILNGAFSDAITDFSRVKHLWMHDASRPPIAKILDIQEVGRDLLPPAFKEKHPTATGALMVKRQYLNHPFADEILTGIREGVISESSIGIDVKESDITLDSAGKPYRVLKKLKLWDTSDVLWGMNPATENFKFGGLTFKEGRVLSKANFQKLQQAIVAIQEVIEAASVQQDKSQILSPEKAAEIERLALAQQNYLIQWESKK